MSSPLAIVVVSYNNAEVLMRCLAAARTVRDAFGGELIVVDNDSPDGSADRVAREMPDVRLFRRPNLGYAAGVNWGVAATTASRLLALNPDCFVEEAALRRCLATMEDDPRIAAISCRVVDEDGHPNLPCRAFPTLRQYLLERLGLDRPYPTLPDPPGPVEVDTITGAFFLMRREAWNDVGPWDEGYFLYSEETDWCWRAKQRGWRIVHEPRASVLHLGGRSTGKGHGDQPVLRKGLLLRTYLDSRERWWRKCYGRVATWNMRGASAAIALVSLAAIALRRGPAWRERAGVEWLRIRHAMHWLPRREGPSLGTLR